MTLECLRMVLGRDRELSFAGRLRIEREGRDMLLLTIDDGLAPVAEVDLDEEAAEAIYQALRYTLGKLHVLSDEELAAAD